MTCASKPKEHLPGHDGTFDFCMSCPANTNCCSKVSDVGQVAPPFLTDYEARRIKLATGLAVGEFAVLSNDTSKVESIKAKNGKCYFYDSERGYCNVYQYRPFDCRIFPFDIIERKDESFVWIVYLDLCPEEFRVSIRYEPYFATVKGMFADLKMTKENVRRFAKHGHELMKRNKYIVLEKVAFEY